MRREMAEIRELAWAYYHGSTSEQQELANQYFRSLDQDGDRRVSLMEYRRYLVNPTFLNEQFFRMLDENGVGSLDFYEVLALYYVERALIKICRGCNRFLLSVSYFSCLLCQTNYPHTFDLCCKCYGHRRFLGHHHSPHNMVHSRVLLNTLAQFMTHATVNFQPHQNNPAPPPTGSVSTITNYQPHGQNYLALPPTGSMSAKANDPHKERPRLSLERLNQGIVLAGGVVSIVSAAAAAVSSCCIM